MRNIERATDKPHFTHVHCRRQQPFSLRLARARLLSKKRQSGRLKTVKLSRDREHASQRTMQTAHMPSSPAVQYTRHYMPDTIQRDRRRIVRSRSLCDDPGRRHCPSSSADCRREWLGPASLLFGGTLAPMVADWKSRSRGHL
jgi:hypothetical protein